MTQWPDRDEAFWNITVGIKKAIAELQFLLKTSEEWFSEGFALGELKRYEEAIVAYDQAIWLNPNYAYAYNNKGIALNNLKRYEEAVIAYDQAIRLSPDDTKAYSNKGVALDNLKRPKEAQQCYQIADQLKTAHKI